MSDRVDGSDEQLTARVRGGDHAAEALLRRRHERAARRLAASLLGEGGPVDDTVSEAFARVLSRLLAGPDQLAFRPMLLQAVRQVADSRVAANRHRRRPGRGADPVVAARTDVGASEGGARLVADGPPSDRALPRGPAFVGRALDGGALDGGAFGGGAFGGGVLGGGVLDDVELDLRLEDPAVAFVDHAYRDLDVADQIALWHSDVEAERPRQVAEVLGIRRGEVRARVEQSRQRLRRAYVRRHLRDETDSQCQVVAAQLVDFLDGSLNRQAEDEVGEHLDQCDRCHTLYVELVDVGRGLRTVVVPAIVGLCAVAVLAMGGPFAATHDPGTPSTVTVEMADPSIPRPRPTTTVAPTTTAAPPPTTAATVPTTGAPAVEAAPPTAPEEESEPTETTEAPSWDATDGTGTTEPPTVDTSTTAPTNPSTSAPSTTAPPAPTHGSGGSGWYDPDHGAVGDSDDEVIDDPTGPGSINDLGAFTLTTSGTVGIAPSPVTVTIANGGAAAGTATVTIRVSSGWVRRSGESGTASSVTLSLPVAAGGSASADLIIFAPSGAVTAEATISQGGATRQITIPLR